MKFENIHTFFHLKTCHSFASNLLTVRTNFGKQFEVHLFMRLEYKDGRKMHYASRRTTFRGASKEYLTKGWFQIRLDG